MVERSATDPRLRRHVRVAEVMGTVISIHVIAHGDVLNAGAETAINACIAELRDIDRVFSTYQEDSDIMRIARGELELADSDPRVIEVEAACREAELETGGLFSAYQEGWFDPTGYVKGWSVENAARRHLAPLIDRADQAVAVGINAGGDMQLFTAPDADWIWRIAIADPHRHGAMVAYLEIVDGAVATSGSAERGRHIRDPRSGTPAEGLASASIVDASLTRADLWATTAVVSGFDERSWIRRAGTRTGILVAEDGRVARWIGGMEVDVAHTASTRDIAAAST